MYALNLSILLTLVAVIYYFTLSKDAFTVR